MNELYQIPKVFINRYVNQLSPSTFCILTRLFRFYLDNEGKREITISFSDFEKEILFDNNHEQIKNIWTELSWWDLVKRIYKENIYELNVTKIRDDNKDFLNNNIEVKKKKFRLKIVGKQIKKERLDVKPQIADFVNKFVYPYSKRIQEKIKRSVSGFIEFYLKEQNTVKIYDISKPLLMLLETDDNVIEKVCEIYNNSESYGKVHSNYFIGILRNINKDKAKIKQKKDFKKRSLEKYEKIREESDRKFGVKIASGNVNDNISYQAYLELKDFDGLRKLYTIGVEILKKQKKEIFTNYDWLKND